MKATTTPPTDGLPLGMPVRRDPLQRAGAAEALERPDRLWRLAATLAAEAAAPLSGAALLACALLQDVLRERARYYCRHERPGAIAEAARRVDAAANAPIVERTVEAFRKIYETNGAAIDGPMELLLLRVLTRNPAAEGLRPAYDDAELRATAPFERALGEMEGCVVEATGEGGVRSLLEILEEPLRAAPSSLSAQLAWAVEHWGAFLPAELLHRALRARDVLEEHGRSRGGGPGPVPVLRFGGDPESERFSQDADWMANVVVLAKSTYVWLDQLSRTYGRRIRRLDEIPDEVLDQLAGWGFSGLWLIGLWERSWASAEIKRRTGNPEALPSAYSLNDYRIADDLGGEGALDHLVRRARERGIRLCADMVPNHFGLDSRWVVEHPDRFLALEHPPYPGYRFDGPDLCRDGRVGIFLEDGYWNQTDAAVVFKRVDRHTGNVRYIYHGNDGTHMPWNDTAQLDYLNPEAREAVIRTVVDVARRFPIIRFDAAMTLARRHVRRLWYPAPGEGGAIPSRAERGLSPEEFDRAMPAEFWREVVDRVAAEAPDTLLLAEAFWLMEGYFVRTLGMHRVYNSAFMHMLTDEDNAAYRQTIKNVLEFSPEVLKRFVNFLSNPDEKPAAEQLGTGDKYFGAAILMVTMPGLPLFGHGQVEGLREKYGLEYRRAYWDEPVDAPLVAHHERVVFPLMRRRWLFSQAEHFALYDCVRSDGHVCEDVFATSNRAGSERAVVLYNTAGHPAAGWIRVTAPVNRGRDGAVHLETRTLAQALALPEDPAQAFLFRDHIRDQWFLRSAAELARDGLFVQLGPYEAAVLLDWRPVDATERGWRRLAARLAGRGVADPEAAREDALAEEARDALRDRLQGLWPEPEPDAEVAGAPVRADTGPLIAALREAAATLDLRLRHLAEAAGHALGAPIPGEALARAAVGPEAVLPLLESAAEFLGVHEHDGVTWFRREPLEALLGAWRAVRRADAIDTAEAAKADSDAAAAAAAVEGSGYRWDALRAALRAAEAAE